MNQFRLIEMEENDSMGFFSNWRASWRKSSNLKKISAVLGGLGRTMDIAELMRLKSIETSALEELFDLIENDPHLVIILKKFGANRSSLKKAYMSLLVCGAGQWARGHWVPASSIAFGTTLPFLLKNTENGTVQDRNTWINVSYELLNYFERGQMTPLTWKQPVQ